MRFAFVWACLLALAAHGRFLRRGADGGSFFLKIFQGAPEFTVTVLRKLPHVDQPFTQGLEFMEDGMLVETSGAYPPPTKSHIRIVDPSTGEVTAQIDQDNLTTVFAEGIARMASGHWVMSTWMDKKALEYDEDLKFVKEHPYPKEGWGFARNLVGNDTTMLATDGSAKLITLEFSSEEGFVVKKEQPITCAGEEVTGMNELEMVEDFLGYGPALLGNIYMTRTVLAINPANGTCFGSLNLQGLESEKTIESSGGHVANGIAYNRENDTFFMTGKNWDYIYEVKIEKAD